MERVSSNYRQILENIKNLVDMGENSPTSFADATILDAKSQGTLFVPILGQSNGEHMSIVYEPYKSGSVNNDTSGAIILDRDLSDLTGNNVVTSDTLETNFAVGGSKANGNGAYQEPNLVWWYPDENRPGTALLEAEAGLKQWLTDNGAQPQDRIAIIWSQGESDVGDIIPEDPETRRKYKQSTTEIFDYLKNNLGYENITFYIVPTGRFQGEAAINVGLNSQEIDSVNENTSIIRQVQAEIALERDDVLLAPDYSDLNMVYEEGQIYGESYNQDFARWSTDIWHLGHDGLKVNGSRLAQYIALDLGQNNVISFTDSFGNPAESISLNRGGILDLNISSSPNENSDRAIIEGTNNPDVIVGTSFADRITGKAGDDLIVGTEGVDTLTGGRGNDVFFYRNLVDGDRITDFEIGSDRLDVAELLNSANYQGTDPLGDNYISINLSEGNNVEVIFDADGVGANPGSTIAILENVNGAEFQNQLDAQFVFEPIEY